MLRYLGKITDTAFWIMDIFCRLVILFMTIIVFLQVILRSFFKTNIPWGEEIVLLVMVWMTFAAMSIGLKEEVHIRIEFFMARFPKNIRKVIVMINNLVLLAVNATMIYYGISLINFTNISKLPVTKLPSSAVFYMIPVSAALSCLAIVGKLMGLYETRGTQNFINGTYEEESLKGGKE
mgnify:CR=1 FL=1